MLPGAGLDDRDHDDPVAHAIREEMAQTLSTSSSAERVWAPRAIQATPSSTDIANRMQMATGWSEERKRREIEALRGFYEVS